MLACGDTSWTSYEVVMSDSSESEKAREGANRRDSGRFSSKRKRDAVLDVLAGRDPADVARIYQVNPETLLAWRDAFVEAGRG